MTKRKRLVRDLDRAFSEYIRERDRHCVTCGSIEHLQCGHLFSRIAYSTRWHCRNAFAQCSGCNLRHEHDPGPLTLYFLRRFGQDAYERLHREYRVPAKYTETMLAEMLDEYRRRVAELRIGG